MSALQTPEKSTSNASSLHATLTPSVPATHSAREAIENVRDAIAPVWPLKDYVAVNPYGGFVQRSFADTESFLRTVSDCELLMQTEYYAEQFYAGQFGIEDIRRAAREMQLGNVTEIEIQAVVDVLLNCLDGSTKRRDLNESAGSKSNSISEAVSRRRVMTIAECVSSTSRVNWSDIVIDKVSRHCASHYDEGQAIWQPARKPCSLFEYWRSVGAKDRSLEVMGVKHFRQLVAALPADEEAAIEWCLGELGVPAELLEEFLICQLLSMPGWSAWAKYQERCGAEHASNDLLGVLAIKLAYEVGLHRKFPSAVGWRSLADEVEHDAASECYPLSNRQLRMLLQRSCEIGYRRSLFGSLSLTTSNAAKNSKRTLAQMVFCIDVRSERLRRNLESTTLEVETFGFAGFFGMPIAIASPDQKVNTPQLPVLLNPRFQVIEGLSHGLQQSETKAIAERNRVRLWRKVWKSFQSSAVGCFSFVESVGPVFGLKLARHALGLHPTGPDVRVDGFDEEQASHLRPSFRGLEEQGIDLDAQIDLAEGMLRNLGIVEHFGRLVVFCGHASQTENNPLAAGLDCGACGGHSGAPNARFAAALLNRPEIRNGLGTRGIDIPADTHFAGALHNTTTDEIQFFDKDLVPPSHTSDLQELSDHCESATFRTQQERMSIVDSGSLSDLMRRAVDWAEVRPEWGLAGNAAFLVGPRELTKGTSLDGQVFLHSYDHRADPAGAVLETIMTAPMIVAHWINMQYYASTVDNKHFGSGNKTVHNVVGKFGILSGNSGDLTTGLPWQSVHTGTKYQHRPKRLQVVIAAPRDAIQTVIEKHSSVADLLHGEWLHLVAIEEGQLYRYTTEGNWALVA